MEKIVECSISNGGWGCPCKVNVVYVDGTKGILFDYFDDELFFTEDQFIGKTKDEALAMHFQADKRYLNS